MLMFKCDRCGCTFEERPLIGGGKFEIHERLNAKDTVLVDLCSNCTNQLETFIEDPTVTIRRPFDGSYFGR